MVFIWITLVYIIVAFTAMVSVLTTLGLVRTLAKRRKNRVAD
jgi:hypothetical protein